MTKDPAAAFLRRYSMARRAMEYLTAPRLAFRQFYDAMLVETALSAEGPTPRSFLHALYLAEEQLASRSDVEKGDPADAREAGARALAALGSPEAMVHACNCAIASGCFDALNLASDRVAAARKAEARRIQRAFGAKAYRAQLQNAGVQRSNAEIQQMIGTEGGYFDPDLMVPAIMLAQQRLCRVTVQTAAGPSIGTGFLIGPSMVLTNWHVVVGCLADQSPIVQFDYGQTTGSPTSIKSKIPARPAWRIHDSPTGDIREEDSTAWWNVEATRKAWRMGLAGSLDYAILHLEGMPGLSRGWYDLSTLKAGQASGACFVLHHPNGQGHTFSAGKFCLADVNAQGMRVFHTASTAKGSSGGLVLDANGQPVALHYLGLGPDPWSSTPPPVTPGQVVNVCIPLHAIFADFATVEGLPAQILETEGEVLVRGCLDGTRPVFGRQDLLDKVPLLKRGDRQVLWVQPPAQGFKRPGKSFTVEILRALARPSEDIFVMFTADRIKSGARAMASMILEALSSSAAEQIPEAQTTEAAYDQVLVSHLREVIAGRWPKRRIWLVIDELDAHDLADDSGRDFLNALYSRIGDIPQLRIVLLGLKVSLDSIPQATLIEDKIDIGDVDELSSLFLDWLQRRGGGSSKVIEASVATLFAKALASYAGSEAPLEQLGQFVGHHLASPLKGYFGA